MLLLYYNYFIFLKANGKRVLDNKKAELRAEGLQMSFKELNNLYPPIPDSENASFLLKKAHTELINPNDITYSYLTNNTKNNFIKKNYLRKILKHSINYF